MSKNKKSKDKKERIKPKFNNDQLGENASEAFTESYDNKKRKNK